MTRSSSSADPTARKGFAATPEAELLFAQGWPHIRLIDDEPMDSQVASEQARRLLLHLDPAPRIRWPRRLAIAVVRAIGSPSIVELLPNEKLLRADVEESLWSPREVTLPELAGGLATRLSIAPLAMSDRTIETWTLLAEALLGTEAVSGAIMDLLEDLGDDLLRAQWALPPMITYQLGYMLLRLPKKEADALRKRIHKLLDRSGIDVNAKRHAADAGTSHLRALWLTVGGVEAARRGSDKNLAWCTHVTDDPSFVRMRATLDKLAHRPDARLVYLGGEELLTVYGRRWRTMPADEQRWFLEQIADIRSPETARIALDMAVDSSIRGEAGAWFGRHKDVGVPYLKANASKEGSTASRARGLLAELG